MRVSRRTAGRAKTHPGEHPSPRRWEYLDLDVHVETWSDSAGRSGRLATLDTGPTRLPSILPVLTELGAQGWELAGVHQTQSPLIYRMILKRRVSALPAAAASATRSLS